MLILNFRYHSSLSRISNFDISLSRKYLSCLNILKNGFIDLISHVLHRFERSPLRAAIKADSLPNRELFIRIYWSIIMNKILVTALLFASLFLPQFAFAGDSCGCDGGCKCEQACDCGDSCACDDCAEKKAE